MNNRRMNALYFLCKKLDSQQNSKAYDELYSKMQDYNSLTPFNERTGAVLIGQERRSWQEKNIERLASLAKDEGFAQKVEFKFKGRSYFIRMLVNGCGYAPKGHRVS